MPPLDFWVLSILGLVGLGCIVGFVRDVVRLYREEAMAAEQTPPTDQPV